MSGDPQAEAYRAALARAQARLAANASLRSGDPYAAALNDPHDPYAAALGAPVAPRASAPPTGFLDRVGDFASTAGSALGHLLYHGFVEQPFNAVFAPATGDVVSGAQAMGGKGGHAPGAPRSLPEGTVVTQENTPGAITPAARSAAGKATAINATALAAFPLAAEAATARIAAPLLRTAGMVGNKASALLGETIAGAGLGGAQTAAEGGDARDVAFGALGGAIAPAAIHAGIAGLGAGYRGVMGALGRTATDEAASRVPAYMFKGASGDFYYTGHSAGQSGPLPADVPYVPGVMQTAEQRASRMLPRGPLAMPASTPAAQAARVEAATLGRLPAPTGALDTSYEAALRGDRMVNAERAPDTNPDLGPYPAPIADAMDRVTNPPQRALARGPIATPPTEAEVSRLQRMGQGGELAPTERAQPAVVGRVLASAQGEQPFPQGVSDFAGREPTPYASDPYAAALGEPTAPAPPSAPAPDGAAPNVPASPEPAVTPPSDTGANPTERAADPANAANAPEAAGAPAAPAYTPTLKHAEARRPNGDLRPAGELSRTHDEGLLAEYARQQGEIDRSLPQTTPRIAEGFGVEGQEGAMGAGATRRGNGPSMQAKAYTRIRQAEGVQQTIAAEMERRGLAPEDLHATAMARRAEQADGDLAVQQQAQDDGFDEAFLGGPSTADAPPPPRVGPDGVLRTAGGHDLFSTPIGPALTSTFAPLRRPIAGATMGGMLGYASGDPDHPDDRRAAMALGMLAGAGLGTAARDVPAAYAAHQLSLLTHAPHIEQLFRDLGSKIDFTGKLAAKADAAGQGNALHRIDRLMQKAANGTLPIDRLGATLDKLGVRPSLNPARALAFVKIGDQTTGHFLLDAPIDYTTRAPIPGAKSLKQIASPFRDQGVVQGPAAMQKAVTYLVAERIAGRGVEAVSGDAAEFAKWHTLATEGRKDPLLSQFATDMRDYTGHLGRYAVDAGLWTEAQWQGIRDSDALYVPFQRIIESPARRSGGLMGRLGGGGASGGLANVGAGVQSFSGSLRDLADPMVALTEYTASTVKRADRYRVGHTLFSAADAMGDAGNLVLTRLTGANLPAAARPAATAAAMQAASARGLNPSVAGDLADTFAPVFDAKNPVIWRNTPNGEREYATVHSLDLVDAISALHTAGEISSGEKVAQLVLRPLRRIVTATATGLRTTFSLGTNIPRDILDSKAKSQYGMTTADLAVGYAQGFAHELSELFGGHGVQAVDDLMRAGLGGSSDYTRSLNPAAMAREIAPMTGLQNVRSLVARAGQGALAPLERLGKASDLGPRLGEARAALRATSDQVASGAWTPAEALNNAASSGRQVSIDFYNKGTSKTAAIAARNIPFFSASLNGIEGMWSAGRRAPAVVAKVTSLVGTASLAAYALNQRLSPEARARFLDRPLTERSSGIEVAAPDGSVAFRFPVGGELGLIHGGITAALDATMEHDPHALGLLWASIQRALPPGIGDGSIPIPGLQQIRENQTNKKSYGGQTVEPQRLQSLPAAERRFDSTRPTFDGVAAASRWVGDHTGLDGLSNTSPLQAENVVRGVFGSAAQYLTPVTDRATRAIMGAHGAAPPAPLAQSGYDNFFNPASAYVPRPVLGAAESENDYYAQRTKIEEAKRFYDQQRTSGAPDIDRLRPYAQKGLFNPDVQATARVADEALKMVHEQEVRVRQARDAAAQSPDANIRSTADATARAALDNLTLARQHVTRFAANRLRAAGIAP